MNKYMRRRINERGKDKTGQTWLLILLIWVRIWSLLLNKHRHEMWGIMYHSNIFP